MDQPVQPSATIQFDPAPLFKSGKEKIDSAHIDYVLTRLNDLARAISERDLANVEPEIAEIAGVDFENEVFIMNRTFRDKPYFLHCGMNVCLWRIGGIPFVNRIVKRHLWRKIFADCEQSIGAHFKR